MVPSTRRTDETLVYFLIDPHANRPKSNRGTVARTRVRDDSSLLTSAARHHGKLNRVSRTICSWTHEPDRHFVNQSSFFSLSPLSLPSSAKATHVPTCNARAISSSRYSLSFGNFRLRDVKTTKAIGRRRGRGRSGACATRSFVRANRKGNYYSVKEILRGENLSASNGATRGEINSTKNFLAIFPATIRRTPRFQRQVY